MGFLSGAEGQGSSSGLGDQGSGVVQHYDG